MYNRNRPRLLPLLQGLYFVGTGVWPIIDLKSFEKVSGFKVDGWLVRTFGALTAAIGGALITSAFERKARSSQALGLGAALSLASADMIYVANRRISRVYLLDAAIELLYGAGWLYELSQCDSKPLEATAGPE